MLKGTIQASKWLGIAHASIQGYIKFKTFFLTENGKCSANALRGIEDIVGYSSKSARADSRLE
jgi:hypothetical protein